MRSKRVRYLKYGFLLILAICLATVALANRPSVPLKLMPDWLWRLLSRPSELETAQMTAPSLELPLFFVILISVAVGLLIGFIWEWIREHKHRAEARERKKHVHRLEAEVTRMNRAKHDGEDDVLALLEERSVKG
ncbi:LapA family protein [Aestuariibius insulae]|uniref:LapA family protein n=1 Tax=Aestuariibius insulae TaxID=2058287 RepID=UPI00398E9F7C